jgi:galactose oxidase
MYDIGKLIVAGGAPTYDVEYMPASNRAYTIDFSNGTMTPTVTRLPDMRFPRTMISLVVLPNGQTIAIGGQVFVFLFSDEGGVLFVELYDPVSNTWKDLSSPMKTIRTYHGVGMLMRDGRVLHGGSGLCGEGCDDLEKNPWNHPDVEILVPPYLLDAAGNPVASRPNITAGPSTFSPNSTIAVTVGNAGAGAHTFAMMKLGTSTHTVNLDQRRVPLPVVSRNGNVFTLQLPANGVDCPPGLYWLFAMDPSGVPSIGWNLRRL